MQFTMTHYREESQVNGSLSFDHFLLDVFAIYVLDPPPGDGVERLPAE